MNLAHAVLPVVVLMSLTACSDGGGDDPLGTSEPGVMDDGTSPTPPPPTPTGDVPETLLEGVWESACLDAAPPANKRRFVVQVTESAFSFGDTTYGDAVCGEASALREIETRGTFVERIPESGQDIQDGIPIDLSIEEVLLIPRQSRVVSAYNDLMLCGVADSGWATNVIRDISNCEDETGTIESNTEAPRTDVNLFLVDDSGTPDVRADDVLRLGTVDSVADAAQRPLMVDQGLPFTRRAGSLQRPL